MILPLFLSAETAFKYVEIKGNKILSKSEIYKNLGLEIPPWYQFWKEHKAKINPKIVSSLQESLENYYRSEGFYHTRVNKHEDNTTVVFQIKEGTPVKIARISIQSNYPIKKLITFKKRARFRAT